MAIAWQLGDLVWDRHYHVTLLSDLHLRGLLAELGLEQGLRWKQTRTAFFSGGRLHSMSNAWEFLRFPPLSLAGKLRLAWTIHRASLLRDWRPLEDLTSEQWLRKWSGDATFEKIWQPLLHSKLGANADRVSAAFIWATIARLYAARRSGLKRELFGYLPGGYSRILTELANHLTRLGVEIRCGHRLRHVHTEAAGGLRLDFEGGQAESFDRVVMTMPSPGAAEVCPDLTPGEREALGSIEYQGILCASVLLKRPMAGYYVTNLTDPGLPFTGVIEMSALVDAEELGGRGLVYLPKYVTGDDPAWGLSDDHMRAEFLRGLVRVYPEFDTADVVEFRVSRVRKVFTLPTLGYSRRLPPMRLSTDGLFLINSAHIVNGTLNVN